VVDDVAAGGPALVRRRAILRAGIVFALVLGLDQLTKHTIATSIAPDETDTVIPGIVHLVHVRNTGVAFGFLSGGGAIVYVLTVVALCALAAFLVRRPERPWLWLPTGMLIGGAIGNLVDRIGRGSVIDFIKLPDWPAFNLADASITVGVVVLLFVIEGGRGRPEES
jgi:signal peptidase II